MQVNGVAVSPDGRRAVSASYGQNAQGVGSGDRRGTVHPHRPLLFGHWRGVELRTGGVPSPLLGTRRSRSGIWRPARNCAHSTATPTRSLAWRSAPDGRRAVSASLTRRSKCGIWRPARNCARSPATPIGLWRGGEPGRAARRLRFLGQHAQSLGSGDRRGTAHARRSLRSGQWRGGESGRAARRLRFLGQDAQGVGSGDRPGTAHPRRPLRLVNGVAVSPDGRRAVSASSDNTLKVWDLETGEELRTLAGHSGRSMAWR